MKTTILLHDIEYWYDMHPNKEITCEDKEHIEEMIKEGNHQGKLVTHDDETDEMITGWWKIEK